MANGGSETTETTRTVKVMDFVQENPPSLLISEAVTGPGGRPRLFTQKVLASDANLWRSLIADVNKGDTISVTVKTVWPDGGRYYTTLVNFASREAHLDTAAPQRDLLEAVGSSV